MHYKHQEEAKHQQNKMLKKQKGIAHLLILYQNRYKAKHRHHGQYP